MHTARPLALLAAALLAAAPAALGQGNSDLFLVRMVVEGSSLRFSVPVNVTNRPGADLDPAFLLDDSALLYASYHNGQADIYRYDVETSATTQLTDTPETELDPQPGYTRDSFTAVRVEADRSMRVWRFPMEGDAAPEVVVPEVGSAVRHAWGFNQVVGFTTLGDTTRFGLVDFRTGEVHAVAGQVGKAVCKIPRQRAVSYVSKGDDGWFIQRYDISNDRSDIVTRTLEGQAEHAWMADAESNLWILAADGPVIYAWEQTQRTWKPVVNFGGSGIGAITRLAVSSDAGLLAFVAERPPVVP